LNLHSNLYSLSYKETFKFFDLIPNENHRTLAGGVIGITLIEIFYRVLLYGYLFHCVPACNYLYSI